MSGEISIKTEDNITIIQATAKKRTNGVDTILNTNDDVTAKVFIFKKPDRTTTEQTGVTVVAGDGTFDFTTATTFFTSNPGEWKVQAKYTLTSTGAILHTQIRTFNVGETLGA